MLRRAVANYSYSSIGTIVTIAVAFLVGGLTIRFLGDQRAGFLMTLQAILATTASVAGGGFGAAGVLRVATLSKEQRTPVVLDVIGTVILINGGVGLIGIVLVSLGFPAIFRISKLDGNLHAEAQIAAVVMGGAFFIQQVSGGYSTLFAGLQRYDILSSLRAGQRITSAVASLLVLVTVPGMVSLSLVSLAIELVKLVVCVRITQKLLGFTAHPKWDSRQASGMLRFGSWAYLNSIASVLMQSADKLILASVGGSTILPYYVIGQNLVQQLHSVLVSQSEFVFPMLAGSRAVGRQLNAVEDRLRWFIAMSSVALYGGAAASAYPLLSRVVSPEFAGRSLVLFMLACLQGVFLAQTIVPFYMNWAKEQSKPNAIIMSVNGILVVITGSVLVGKLGALGMSLAQLWVGPMMVALIAWSISEEGGISVRRLLRPLLSPAALLTIWAFLLGWVWLLGNRGDLENLLFSMCAGGLAAAVAVVLERLLFGRYECVQTSFEALRIALVRPVRRRGRSQ